MRNANSTRGHHLIMSTRLSLETPWNFLYVRTHERLRSFLNDSNSSSRMYMLSMKTRFRVPKLVRLAYVFSRTS